MYKYLTIWLYIKTTYIFNMVKITIFTMLYLFSIFWFLYKKIVIKSIINLKKH